MGSISAGFSGVAGGGGGDILFTGEGIGDGNGSFTVVRGVGGSEEGAILCERAG